MTVVQGAQRATVAAISIAAYTATVVLNNLAAIVAALAAQVARLCVQSTGHGCAVTTGAYSTRLKPKAGQSGSVKQLERGNDSLPSLHGALKDVVPASALAGRQKRVGIGFSAGGFLFPYHVGVVRVLRRRGVLHEQCPVVGVSAGALVAALVCCGAEDDTLTSLFLECVRELRSQGTAGRIRGVLERALHHHLPDNAHELCSGRLHVGVTRLALPLPYHVQVSKFPTRQALIQTLLASCHLPGYASRAWAVPFQGGFAVDGGFTGLVPSLPASAAGHTIKVCCLPASRVARLPFLNKGQAMDGVAIIPDHPRTLNPSRRTSAAVSMPHTGSTARGQPAATKASTWPDHPRDDPSWTQMPRSFLLSATAGPATPLITRHVHHSSRASGSSDDSWAVRSDTSDGSNTYDCADSHTDWVAAPWEGDCAGAVPCACSATARATVPDDTALLREMQQYVNVPAPDDSFYTRLVAKAERDTLAWLAESGQMLQ